MDQCRRVGHNAHYSDIGNVLLQKLELHTAHNGNDRVLALFQHGSHLREHAVRHLRRNGEHHDLRLGKNASEVFLGADHRTHVIGFLQLLESGFKYIHHREVLGLDRAAAEQAAKNCLAHSSSADKYSLPALKIAHCCSPPNSQNLSCAITYFSVAIILSAL